MRVTTLPHGLTVITREDHSAPVVSAQAWCGSGSIDEGEWLGGGLSHALEHMLFKGTTHRGAGRIDQEVQDAGGYMNAYTSFDRTVYWINVPNTGGRVAIDVLGDIMQNATLPEEELEQEKQVIRREMDMNQDDPHRRASRRLFETAYVRSPYRFTIIGYPDIFNELKREDIFNYYRAKYAPNNCFFVVAGAIGHEAVVEQLSALYSKAKMRALAPLLLPLEPPQSGARETIEEAAIELGHLHQSWHIPDSRHPDGAALDVLSTLLGGGRSSRLFRQVRERQGLVNSVDAWTYGSASPGLFGMSAVINGDKLSAARAAMAAEIARLQDGLVEAEELDKVVKQFLAGTLSTRKTMQGQAHDLGANWILTRDLSFSERYLAAVRNVTREDLQRVAQVYLTPARENFYALMPAGTTRSGPAAAEVHVSRAVEKFELPNGLRVLVKEDHRLPFVEVRAVLQGGVLAETPATSGITQLLAKMLLQGTARRSAEQIALEAESVGGSIDSFGGNNSFGLNLEILRDDFENGLELFADVLRNPAFPGSPLEREKEIQTASIKAQRDQILQSANRALRRALFGEASYGLDLLGTEESLGKIGVENLRKFHRELAVPGNCVLAIFGDIESATVRRLVERFLGDWPASGRPPVEQGAPRPSVASTPGLRRVSETRDKKQAVLVLGFPGLTVHHQDRYALELLQEACSDLGSRLFVRIREKQGLAYYVGAQHFPGLQPGYFSFYVGTMPEKIGEVERELLHEADLLRREGLSAEELKRAKAKIIGQKKIARQDLGGHAAAVALDELYGLGFAHIEIEDAAYEAVTGEEIRAAAQTYLREDRGVISVVGPDERNQEPTAGA